MTLCQSLLETTKLKQELQTTTTTYNERPERCGMGQCGKCLNARAFKHVARTQTVQDASRKTHETTCALKRAFNCGTKLMTRGASHGLNARRIQTCAHRQRTSRTLDEQGFDIQSSCDKHQRCSTNVTTPQYHYRLSFTDTEGAYDEV